MPSHVSKAVARHAVKVEIAPHRMTATVWVDPALAPEGVDLVAVEEALAEAGVTPDERLMERLAATVARLSTTTPLVLARGITPVLGVAPVLKLDRDADDLPPSGPLPKASVVSAGEVVGYVVQGQRGVEGRDVCGKRLPSGTPKAAFTLGTGVQREPDGAVRATATGRLSVGADGTVRVVTLTDFQGDLDHAHTSALPEVIGDLRVNGSVRDGVALVCEGTLITGHAVEAISVRAEGNMTVGGGLLGAPRWSGAQRGDYHVGRNLHAKFLSGARADVGGDVLVEGDVVHGEIVAGGKIIITERVHGSRLSATGGVSLRGALNTTHAPTVIEVGFDRELLEFASKSLPDIEDSIEKIQHGKQSIVPLLHRQSALTSRQKEQAVRLIHDTTVLESEVSELTAPLKHRWQAAQQASLSCIEVGDVINPGVILKFPNLEATVTTVIRGPVRIRPDTDILRDPKLLVQDAKTGETLSTIPARHVGNALTARLTKLMARIA